MQAYIYLTQLLMFEAIIFIYKALLEIALDDDKRRSLCSNDTLRAKLYLNTMRARFSLFQKMAVPSTLQQQ
jgi:hypothetical protein